MRLAGLLPAGLRRRLLAVAEIGHEDRRDLRLALLARRRTLFLDVGANRGQFARFVSAFFDRVVVFEPIERFAAELRTVLAQNCTVHACALADVSGPATFYVPSDGDPATVQTASLVAPEAERPHLAVAVEVRRLDDFGFTDVAFIKVDIEGAEYAFLDGARETLRRCRPVLLVEIEARHTGGETKRVFDLLAGLGYRAFVPRERDGDARGASALRRLLRGLLILAAPARIALEPIDALIETAHTGPGTLNEAFGPGYVNNFVFLPDAG